MSAGQKSLVKCPGGNLIMGNCLRSSCPGEISGYPKKKTNIFDQATNWNALLIKVSLQVRFEEKVSKSGLKASKEFQLCGNIFSCIVTIVFIDRF